MTHASGHVQGAARTGICFIMVSRYDITNNQELIAMSESDVVHEVTVKLNEERSPDWAGLATPGEVRASIYLNIHFKITKSIISSSSSRLRVSGSCAPLGRFGSMHDRADHVPPSLPFMHPLRNAYHLSIIKFYSDGSAGSHSTAPTHPEH